MPVPIMFETTNAVALHNPSLRCNVGFGFRSDIMAPFAGDLENEQSYPEVRLQPASQARQGRRLCDGARPRTTRRGRRGTAKMRKGVGAYGFFMSPV